MSDFQKDLRNYVESAARPVTAEEVMGSGLVPRGRDRSARRGLVVAFVAAAAVLAAVVGASFLVNQVPDQVVPIGTTATTVEPDPAPNSTVPSTTEPVPPSTTPAPAAIPVSNLFDGEGPRDALVSGVVVWDGAGALLCDSLLKSYPAQCGGLSLVIVDPENLRLSSGDAFVFEQAQGVRWTAGPVEISTYFDGNRLMVGGAEVANPTTDDQALVAAFKTFAASPDQILVSAVPFAADVALGLGPDIVKTVSADTLGDPDTWTLDREIFRAYTGPFSALNLVEEPLEITIGAHPHCASPPVAPPVGFETNRRVSIQPESVDSCLTWWTVDFFLDGNGDIGAVTMDLYEP